MSCFLTRCTLSVPARCHAGVVDALLTDGVLDFAHIGIIPIQGWADDERLIAAHRKRVAFYVLPGEARDECMQRYRTNMATGAPAGAKPRSRFKGVGAGPVRDALEGNGPKGWHCSHGARRRRAFGSLCMCDVTLCDVNAVSSTAYARAHIPVESTRQHTVAGFRPDACKVCVT